MTSAELIAPLAAAGATHVAIWMAGSLVRERIVASAASRDDDPLRRAFQSAMLGLAALGSLAFALGALRLLYTPVVAGITVVFAAWGLLRLARLVITRPTVRLAPKPAHVPMMLAAALLVSQIPRALLPILEHDENVYHLFLPKMYLETHALSSLPSSLFANMPHLVDLTYVFPMALGGFTAAKVFVLGFVAWTFVGFASFGRRILGPIGPGLLAVLYLSARAIQWHLGLTYVEPVLGALLLCAVDALWRYHEDGGRAELLVLAIATGAACASKYTVWPHAVVLFAAAALARPGGGRRIGPGALAVMVGIWMSIVGPWLVKSAVVTGNPIYPNAYGVFGGPGWSQIQTMQFERSMQFGAGAYSGIVPYLRLPLRLVVDPYDGPLQGASFSASVMVLLVASMALPWRRAEFRTTLRLLAVAGLVFWALGPKQVRYLVAWLPVMVVTAGLALAPLRRFRGGLVGAIAVVLVVGLLQLRLQPFRAWPLLDAFTVSRDELLTRNFCWDLTQLLNRVVPPGGRVLSFWENRLYFLDRPFVADSAFGAPTPLARLREAGDAHAFARALAAEGFTHVVIRPYYGTQYLTNQLGYDILDERLYPAERLRADGELFTRFVSTELERLPVEGDWMVLRLKPSPSDPSPRRMAETVRP